MCATTDDISGSAPEGQLATPDSYGEAPGDYRLPATTSLGPVRLQVADLGRSLAFYDGILGLRPSSRDGDDVVLTAQGEDVPLIELHQHAAARPAPPRGRLGLYHVALLLPDRASLGRFAHHLATSGVRAGAGDHLVSEAFYLQDPDNLGIEVYADRPRESWRRIGRELMMATDPVDVAGLVRTAGDTRWQGMPAGTAIGHVHLHVGDIPTGASFFSETLGFDRTVWHYPGALFLSAGGYHHHLGTNTWAGAGARPPGADDARLLEWTIEVPDDASVATVGQRLAAAGHTVGREGTDRLVTQDPWGTGLRLRVKRTRS